MSFRPGAWRLRAAATLVLVLGLALALALAGRAPVTPDRDPARAVAAGVDRAPAPGTAVAAAGGADQAAGPAGERGPSCDPGGHGHGRGAGVLPRGGVQEHAQLAAGRYAPEQARPRAASRARVPVRGPDQRAPKPVELSVMRV
ncbi:hypothetical protein [Streptomyces racemochromogenes]|uniref:hypothetical protein n=1 Tax=Streptomyces racemochromogenes TaxID=67353 RepID=UPI0031E65DBA